MLCDILPYNTNYENDFFHCIKSIYLLKKLLTFHLAQSASLNLNFAPVLFLSLVHSLFMHFGGIFNFFYLLIN